MGSLFDPYGLGGLERRPGESSHPRRERVPYGIRDLQLAGRLRHGAFRVRLRIRVEVFVERLTEGLGRNAGLLVDAEVIVWLY